MKKTITNALRPQRNKQLAAERRARELCDYAKAGLILFWRRQISFSAALALAAYYYDTSLALVTLVLIAIAEAYDLSCFRAILATRMFDTRTNRMHMRRIYIGTLLSAGTIVFYVLWISFLQGPTTHFMPLFFLFAAALFAAMNNHQLLPILVMRVVIYGATFLIIPIWDIRRTGANIHSELWTQLFTSIFVLFFIIECSRVYLRFYRKMLDQMDELREKNERTEAAYAAKSEFLATISHELRTPMTSINGALQLVLSGKVGPLSEKAASLLGIAERNGKRLSTLIDDTLDLQKIESGKLELEFDDVEMGVFLRRAIETNQPYAAGCSVSFRADLPANPILVSADWARLDQVMANLLSNAAKFSHPGDEVTVRLETEGNSVRVLVIDHGVGLSEEYREKVFDRFSQLDSSDTRRSGGTGLGMNISKRIIEAHGGQIDYRKNEGPGTTFFFELDMLDREDSPIEHENRFPSARISKAAA